MLSSRWRGTTVTISISQRKATSEWVRPGGSERAIVTSPWLFRESYYFVSHEGEKWPFRRRLAECRVVSDHLVVREAFESNNCDVPCTRRNLIANAGHCLGLMSIKWAVACGRAGHCR